ncbi:hypothetical protein [Curtobacterium aurantiacum]|uniref:Uncharacterized protein n=1 Tax=Curtobacterium aurantiacum TaxID=3236919 RepID=A0ABS5VFW7_9MICO|nr:hypothetical protein [Curtobacterium flaccumfaciens]MBT1544650.1 hypothetical protein [Curtobacterium flaccumfaciens pv. flaccumfaciens]MBT1587615.1 hypothetical protein [Curtobacterium flaccumfaciens pv. flaccumfaciens]
MGDSTATTFRESVLEQGPADVANPVVARSSRPGGARFDRGLFAGRRVLPEPALQQG